MNPALDKAFEQLLAALNGKDSEVKEVALEAKPKEESVAKTEEPKMILSKTIYFGEGVQQRVWLPQFLRNYFYYDLDTPQFFQVDADRDDDKFPQTEEFARRYSVPFNSFLSHMDTILKAHANGNLGSMIGEETEQLSDLINRLQVYSKNLVERLSGNLDGSFSPEEIVALISSKEFIFTYEDDCGINAFRGISAEITSSFFGKYMTIQGEIRTHLQGSPEVLRVNLTRPLRTRTLSLADLGLRLLDDEVRAQLVARGKRYVEITKKPTYLRLEGNVTRRNWWSDKHFRSDGRVMVDFKGFRKMDPDYSQFRGYEGRARTNSDQQSTAIADLTDDDYVLMPPVVYGFSFVSKAWGEMKVDGLHDIAFRTDAYDMLVMEEDTKSMMFSLVDCEVTNRRDLIDGKGGGVIFLLEGSPGVGKTLSAEAIAEKLQRPLYMVGVGELGTDVETLEESLRNILDVATTWNAVVLLDECDIFMEKRSDLNIIRNAMVGVFLRLLEYYQGVMFLTSNRGKDIDQAFYSRISLAIHFDELTEESRTQIWKNLVGIYGITLSEDEIKHLAEFELNGRKIKNTLRVGSALAAAEKRTPVFSDFKRVIDRENAFKAHLESSN